MAGNSFGQVFKITTFGESHGGCTGVVIDGCPPGLEICEEVIQYHLDRRKPGQSKLTTPRKEADQIKILSGVFEGKTTGTPVLLLAHNQDTRPEDYRDLAEVYRPSHADFTYEKKYGFRDWRGSGRASARETLARVAAGAVARCYLESKLGMEFLACVEQVGSVEAHIDMASVSLEDIEANPVRCPDASKVAEMIKLIQEVKDQGDSIGGIVQGIIRNVPTGLGEPVFDKLHADLAKAMVSINAVKGFEIGSGFKCATMLGSEHNDGFFTEKGGRISTQSNNAGGVLGGISSGQDITFRVAFKPVATIGKEQNTVDRNGKKIVLQAAGRHDPCVLPRAVPIVEAMAALVIMDHYLRNRAQNG